MKQKSIASFFSKPAGAAVQAPTKKADDAPALTDPKPPTEPESAADRIPSGKKVSEDSPSAAPAVKGRLRRLKRFVVDDEGEGEQAARLSLEDNLEDDILMEEDVKNGAATVGAKAEAKVEPKAEAEAEPEEPAEDGPAPKKRKLEAAAPAADSKASPNTASAAAPIFIAKPATNTTSPAKNQQQSLTAKLMQGAKSTSTQGGQQPTAPNKGKAAQKSDDKKSEKVQGDKKPAASSKGKATEKSVKSTGKSDGKKSEKAAGADKDMKDVKEDEDSIREADAMEDEVEEEEKVKLKPMAVLKPMSGKGKGSGKVEGVGAGAIQAAARHGTFNLKDLTTWPAGKPVPYAFLVDTFEAIAETTKRLLIIQMLVNAFRAIIATTPEDLLPTVYLCSDRVAPAHTGIELGVGEAILVKSLAHVTGRKEAVIKKQYEESGDLGMVAVQNKATQSTMFKPAPLTVSAVFKTFKEISLASGQASQEKKKGLIVKLLVASTGSEAGYIMRSLQGKLRIGLAEQSVLVALAHAVLLQREKADNKKGDLADRLEQAAQIVKAAYSECPSYDKLVPALLDHGVAALPQHCHFMPGVPVRPMLAKATNGVSEVLDKFQDCEFTCEYKYDGERAQIHVLEDGKVQIYSRNAEDTTSKYIDVVKRMKSLLKPHVKSIVIDSEVVAYDRETKRILPFQVLSTRARKDVNEKDIKVQVCSYAFDCLYLNGTALLTEPLTARREALYSALEEQEGLMQFAVAKVSRDVEELETFLNDSVEHGTEGLIVKTLADTYEPSKRSSHWLKLKKDYLDGVGDTFDVVPIGAWHGKGKRTGLFGAYLLAIYDPDSETFQTISKLGTGFSEEVLQELADSLREHIIDKPRSYYTWGDTLQPDVWFDTVTVWEVKAADLSISPVHKAAVGMVDRMKGISIRFPRLLRVRDDKKPEDATTPEQVADMYKRQAVVNSQKKKQVENDEE